MREGFAKLDKLDVVMELLTKLVQQSPNAEATNDSIADEDLQEGDTVNDESHRWFRRQQVPELSSSLCDEFFHAETSFRNVWELGGKRAL